MEIEKDGRAVQRRMGDVERRSRKLTSVKKNRAPDRNASPRNPVEELRNKSQGTNRTLHREGWVMIRLDPVSYLSNVKHKSHCNEGPWTLSR